LGYGVFNTVAAWVIGKNRIMIFGPEGRRHLRCRIQDGSILKVAKSLGIGTGTVQRISNELGGRQK
jgi:hypothetical protein